MINSIEAWEACVRKAKKKYGVSDKFTLIKGKVLREAQKCFGAMGF